ncbi:hypothetical protein, partial [Escherichia coli]|uniref:hypothetical protein n=1 Tax=Escherichia coli TaxID=562 RepID=UPI0013D2BE0B
EPTLRATGLVQPGSLNRWSYRILLPPGTPDSSLDAARDRIRAATPEAGWEIRSRDNADPRFAKSIERFTQFLT